MEETTSEVVEEYLLEIYILNQAGEKVKANKLAAALNSKPSTVFATLQRMKRDDLVKINRSKEITLTTPFIKIQKLKRKMSQFQKVSKLQSLEVDLVEVLLQIYLMKNLKLEYLKKEVMEMEKLNSDFIFSNIRKPFSSPGPRKESIEERFALSKEALKIYGIPSSSVIETKVSATFRAMLSDSITFIPPTSTKGSLLHSFNSQTDIVFCVVI